MSYGARRLLGFLRWYLRELSGEADYHRYVERYRRAHPGAPVPGWAEYQRVRVDRPDGRCC